MNDERNLLLDWRVWLASGGGWCLLLTLTFAAGGGRISVDGIEPMWSWATLRELLLNAGPFTVGTVVLWAAAGRLASRRGFRFWGSCLGYVLVMAAAHAVFAGWRFGLDEPLFWYVTFAFASAFQYAAVLGVGIAVRQRQHAERQQRELLATQLRALRAQLQPHFLFNTLHAIGVTAKSDGATAARMTVLLGDLLRQTLRERSGDLVSLAEEQEMLQPYLALQRLRFGDRLRVDVELPATLLGAAVPDLVLQPLVENALQHGIEQRPGGGHVRVVARRDVGQLVIEVHDDGAGLGVPPDELTLGTGLGATRARLLALYGDGASLSLRSNERGGTTACLRLPWEVAHAA